MQLVIPRDDLRQERCSAACVQRNRFAQRAGHVDVEVRHIPVRALAVHEHHRPPQRPGVHASQQRKMLR
ncbi:hypothetical protein G6F40_018062 [Rhizopus arrhizus]|uniref:Uncharacterized protein n=1 Tax=Rhizopus oryzae TaxID=64495 RepID=A0A9P6WRW2_RHIOR|nr:hypothetical protein G6F24_018627 [Rhizopus arrhizus]KAG1060488.1 hypothetical protein G6F40_018062 [Rhizopus arrhizus]KAG1249772.1 hypothetical protein G6F66_015433 [Rhizopus arrhizus]KAG1273747.1 hypothetical protein G6F64_015285 [Rhizopus arrhizus]